MVKKIEKLIDNLDTAKEPKKYQVFKEILKISEKKPKKIYPYWDFFASYLNGNSSKKYVAINIIANLVKADAKNQFEKIFNKFYSLLNDESVIPAALVAMNSGKIVLAKPKLESKITQRLLNLKKCKHRHKNLIIAGAIESFDLYFNKTKEKKKIIKFAKDQLKAKNMKTKQKMINNFIKKHENINHL